MRQLGSIVRQGVIHIWTGAVRGTTAYRRVGLVGGSCVIAVLAAIWLIERAFLIKIIS